MPYPRAHWYVLAVIAIILAGFWQSYFAPFGTVPWQFHAHGVAASLWVMMVFGQSWTAHHRQLPLHRAIGRSSLFLFPFLIGGLAAIIDVTAKGFVAGEDPVRTMFGGAFLAGLVVAIAAYVTVYFRALKFRRKVWVHSGYMLTTPLILFESPFSRVLLNSVPGLTIRGPQDIHLIMDSILWSIAIELAIIAAIWFKYRGKATPFLVAGVLIAVQMIVMGPLGDLAIFKSLLVMLGSIPSATIVMTGFAIGAATSWAGWQAGRRQAIPSGPAVRAA
jgi:hypothetical protein